MDFSKIKYIFQIPLDWFRSVDNRVFGDHPGHGLKTDSANDGSKVWSVDVRMIIPEIMEYIPEPTTSGFTGTFDVVRSVSWDGSVLTFTKSSLTYSNGLLSSVGSESTTTIDTPVAVDVTL